MRKLTDDILPLLGPYVHKDDAGADWLTNGNQYEWYYSYARHFRPKRVLEIGVHRGYSAICFHLGCSDIEVFALVDDGREGVPVVEGAENLCRAGFNGEVLLRSCDTQKVQTLGLPGVYDLAHVDAYHSRAGVYRELQLVLQVLSSRGVVVVDDYGGEVKEGVIDFVNDHPLVRILEIVPTYRCHALLARHEP